MEAGVLFTAAVIKNGDYVMENGTLLQCDYIDELLQNIEIAVKTERGGFYPDCSFGSYLGILDKEPLNFYALAYARQALGDFDGVFVKSAEAGDGDILLNLIINGEERQVTMGR